MLIEICGGIASGKTTLCTALNNIGAHPVKENFHANPFLEDFYGNPPFFAFETELSFLLQHYSSIKKAKTAKCHEKICFDFSLEQDCAYADLNLTGKKLALFYALETELRAEIGYPDKLIYLTCPPEVLLQRIKKRNREVEQSITLDYLASLNAALGSRVNLIKDSISVITINTNEVDFRISLSGIEELLETLIPEPKTPSLNLF